MVSQITLLGTSSFRTSDPTGSTQNLPIFPTRFLWSAPPPVLFIHSVNFWEPLLHSRHYARCRCTRLSLGMLVTPEELVTKDHCWKEPQEDPLHLGPAEASGGGGLSACGPCRKTEEWQKPREGGIFAKTGDIPGQASVEGACWAGAGRLAVVHLKVGPALESWSSESCRLCEPPGGMGRGLGGMWVEPVGPSGSRRMRGALWPRATFPSCVLTASRDHS